jgi:hypothetical protein
VRKRVDQGGEPLLHDGGILVVLATSGGSDLGDRDRIAFKLVDTAQEIGVRQMAFSSLNGDGDAFCASTIINYLN